LATALGQVHRRPSSIRTSSLRTYSSTTSATSGYGFGIASQLWHERQAPAPPEIIGGALTFVAPEQTGRINPSIGIFRTNPRKSGFKVSKIS
jgi:hypothetical protein